MIQFSLKVDINAVPGMDTETVNAYGDRLKAWLETMPESMGVVVESLNTTAVLNRQCAHIELNGTGEVIRPSSVFPKLTHESDIKIHVAYRLKDKRAWQNWIGTDTNPESAAQAFNLLLTPLEYEIRMHCADSVYEQRFRNQLMIEGRLPKE